jgi:hypothetical protein
MQMRGDFNPYAFVSTVEIGRTRRSNPTIPEFTRVEYFEALEQLGKLALIELSESQDRSLIQCAIQLIALSKGSRTLGLLIELYDHPDVEALIEETFGAQHVNGRDDG